MKKIFFIGIFFCVCLTPFTLFAQRYLPGMRGIQAAAGITEKNGFFVHAGYAKYTKWKNRIVFDAEFIQRNYDYLDNDKIPVMQFAGEAGYYFKLFNDNTHSFFLSFGVHVGTGYESVNKDKKMLPDGSMITNQSHWIYGGAVALEAEYYLDDKYILILFVKERIYGGSSVSTFHTLAGAGIKFILD